MDSTSSSSPEARSIDSSKITRQAEEEQNGRPAMMVDGVMRWIKEDGTPGDIVSNGNFYFTQFHDGTFRLFNKEVRSERTAEFLKVPSARFNHLVEDSMFRSTD